MASSGMSSTALIVLPLFAGAIGYLVGRAQAPLPPSPQPLPPTVVSGPSVSQSPQLVYSPSEKAVFVTKDDFVYKLDERTLEVTDANYLNYNSLPWTVRRKREKEQTRAQGEEAGYAKQEAIRRQREDGTSSFPHVP